VRGDERGLSGDPDPFYDTFVLPLAARAVGAAIRLGVFDSLAAEPASPAELAGRLGLDPLGVGALCRALVSLGYLERGEHGTCRVSPAVAPRVVTGAPQSIATFAGDFGAHHWDAVGLLERVMRDGETAAWHDRGPDDPLWDAYITGLFELSAAEQDGNAALVDVDDPQLMVDVAGGHGSFAMAMCRRHPDLQATVLDLPGSARIGRRIVRREGFSERVSFVEGDVFEADLGSDLDVVSVFNLMHHLAPERVLELMRRALAALRPGGCLVIGDTERPEPGAAVSQVGALTGLAYYVSSHARTYTVAEYRGWLREAGFSEVEVHRSDPSPWRVVIVASAPG
jgi:SAM-dependent methyltransferase